MSVMVACRQADNHVLIGNNLNGPHPREEVRRHVALLFLPSIQGKGSSGAGTPSWRQIGAHPSVARHSSSRF